MQELKVSMSNEDNIRAFIGQRGSVADSKITKRIRNGGIERIESLEKELLDNADINKNFSLKSPAIKSDNGVDA